MSILLGEVLRVGPRARKADGGMELSFLPVRTLLVAVGRKMLGAVVILTLTIIATAVRLDSAPPAATTMEQGVAVVTTVVVGHMGRVVGEAPVTLLKVL